MLAAPSPPSPEAEPVFRLLGPIRAVVDGDDLAIGGRLARGLLAMLLLETGSAVTADRLILGLWPDPPPSARATLQTMVYRLRRATGRDVAQVAGGYRIDAVPEDSDVGLLRRALDAADGRWSAREVLVGLDRALALRRGDPLADLDELPFAAGARAELAERVGRAVRLRATLRLDVGEVELAAEELAADAAPTDERAQALRATALARSGRQADALAVIARTRDLMREELGLDLGAGLRDLEARLLREDASLLEAGSPPPVAGSAPATPAPQGGAITAGGHGLIGRDGLVVALQQLLADAGAVALTGPPGVGKSSLAGALLADGAGAASAHRPVVADLSGLRTGALVPIAACAAVGVHELGTAAPTDALVTALRARPTALVLDGCEAVAEDVAALVVALRREVAELHLVVTSRQRIEAPDLPHVAVPPLAVDGADGPGPAVDLLAGRLRRAGGDPDAPGAVAALHAIAEQLDGLPIALVLAGGLFTVLSPAEVAERLGDPVGLLHRGSAAGPQHQRSLARTLDHSTALLDPDVLRLHRRLSVFQGRFDVAAVEQVAALDDLPPAAVPGLLAALVAASLVHPTDDGGRRRMALLRPVRAHAAVLLDAAGADERDRTTASWESWVAGTVHRADAASRGPGGTAALDAVDGVLDDLRAVLATAVRDARPDLAMALCGALRGYWFWRNHPAEGLLWCDQVLALDGGEPALRARALMTRGLMGFLHGDLLGAREALDKAAAHLEPVDPVLAAEAVVYAGAIATLVGDPAAGEALSRAEQVFVRHDRHDLRAELLAARAMVRRLLGDPEGAAADAAAGSELAEMAGHGWGEGWARMVGGKLALDAGDHRAAAEQLRRAIRINVERGDVAGALIDLHHLAGALAAGGEGDLAALLVGFTTARADQLGYHLEATDPVDCARTVDVVTAACGDRLPALMAEGAQLPMAEVLAAAGCAAPR